MSAFLSPRQKVSHLVSKESEREGRYQAGEIPRTVKSGDCSESRRVNESLLIKNGDSQPFCPAQFPEYWQPGLYYSDKQLETFSGKMTSEKGKIKFLECPKNKVHLGYSVEKTTLDWPHLHAETSNRLSSDCSEL